MCWRAVALSCELAARLSEPDLVKLVLLDQLAEQVQEVGFRMVADVVHVPQARLCDLGPDGVGAEPSRTRSICSLRQARGQADAVALDAVPFGAV